MVETRSQSKANTDTTATEVDRVQLERRERSRGGDRPASAAITATGIERPQPAHSPGGDRTVSTTVTEGVLTLPISSSTQPVGTDPCDQAQPSLANRPSVRSISDLDANVKAPSRSVHSVHSKQSCSERTHSSRSSVTVRAQKLAIEADAIRRRVERERELARQQTERERELARQQTERERELARQQMERERQQAERERELARLEAEAEETELQARLAALEASDKSSKSNCSRLSNCNSAKRTATWVLEQNMNTVTNTNMPGEEPTVTLGNPHGHLSQPAAPTNTVSFYVPNVNNAAPSNATRATGNDYNDTAAQKITKSSERPTSDPVTQLTQAINALSNRPKRPELVTFSGEVSQWMAFKSSYERTKSNFSPSDNLDRLNNAVRGPAYQSVASLMWTSGEPDDIVSALEQTYARPELLVAREVAELRNSPKLSSAEELNRLANKLRNFVTTLKLLNQSEYLSSPELFRCTLVKLSEHTRARFTDFASIYVPDQPNFTKLEILSSFLLEEADKQLKYNFVADSTVKAQNTTHPTNRFQSKKETIHATVSNDKVPERCTYCKQGPHNLKTCKAFLALSIDDRWRWVRETKICYRCLKSSPHTWNFCRAKRCGVDGCPRRHNALLHGTVTENSKPSVTSSSQCNNTQALLAEPTTPVSMDNLTNELEPSVKIGNTSDTLMNVTGTSPSTDRPRGLLKVVPIVLEGPDGQFHTTALLDEGSTATLIDGEVAARIGAKPTSQERLRIEGVGGMTKEVDPPPVAHTAPLALPAPSCGSAPPASLAAAPRTIVIQRPDARYGFGFTLRHLVVYPPDSLQELYEDARHLAVGAVGAPMDTIFVRSVRPGGPAAAAGLRAGDRVLAVNGEPVACGRSRAPYARVVQLAQREPFSLRLTVVPRDHDLLQRYFSEAAYNPESNQRHIEMPAPITEHESRLFDAYRRPRAALPAPQAPRREDPEYASVASLAPSRYEPRLPMTPHHLLHDSRRESDTSLPSSATESKDSLGSFDSNSTLTGRELDDSIILSRIRKSLEQKEAFLRRPSQPTGWVTPDVPPPIKQKEFYARPQKLQKPAWPPPSSPPLAASPPPSLPPQELKRDDCSASVDSGTYSGYGEVNGTHNDKQRLKQDKSQFVSTLSKIQETAPSNNGSMNNGSSPEYQDAASTSNTDSRYPVPELQLVTARTRQLEEARGGDERRTEVARSELARMSATRLEPSVALRRKEFETRAARREARSLDVQPQQDLEHDIPLGGSLSGNQLMITGSKYLHCPPPENYVPETEKVQMRTRSNSTGSEGLPIRRHHATDGSHAKRRMGLNREQMEAMNRVSLPGAVNGLEPAVRPTQLSLAPRSAASSAATSPASPSPTPSTPADSGFADDLVTRRQKKDAQLGAEEERAMRRVSYLKATWGDRLHLDSDPEPDADHALRSPEKKGEVGENESVVEAIEGDVQGNVQIKMVVSNGKRASDRSWKQEWAVLHGTKLHLYRHHPSQSPGAVSGSTAGAESSRDTLDMRYSLAALADDYTKRKHVVRVTTAAGAELLLQAEGPEDAQRWLAALRRHSAEPPPAEPAPAPECPSPLPPQRSKKLGRNRSPTGPPTPTLPSSPKNKTWKGRMAKQLRRMHGGGAAAVPAPASGWLGAPLERCPTDPEHPLVPRAVTLPAHAVEAFGLRTVGVYRVPGNAAGVAALAAALDRGEPPPEGDARWADVHVASSLLKAYLRRLPDPLLTADMYPAFIAADRSPERARELRRLVHALPDPHYETLKYLIQHLRRVVAHSSHNKMEARNLAIVFGPTLVRAASDDMLAMVNDMSSQCRIIESFLSHYDWYFEEEEGEPPVEPPATAEEMSPAPAPSRDLLIHNVKKMEGKDVSTRDIVSSIISAANRKIQRKPRSKPSTDKKWSEPDKRVEASPGASPPSSPLASPPAHLTTTLADYDGLPHRFSQSANKAEMESISVLGRGRQELSRHTHTLQSFSIDGTGDLVSSLTSTFDQKLRTLNNSSPLDDGSIPYADEPSADELSASGGGGGGGSPSEGSAASDQERVSPAARAQELKAAWLARDHRHSSSSSNDEPDARWPRPHARRHHHDDDSEKENCVVPEKDDEARSTEDEKDVDTRSQASETMPDNDKTIDRVLYPTAYKGLRQSNPECVKRNSAALENGSEKDVDCSKLKRSESLNRDPERSAARVLRSESLNTRLQRSESLSKGERLSKLEKGEWNVVRRREGAWRSTKLKRKNGMPERGIKRRHTVGGTKDFDKDGWSARHTRTSSPDLSRACVAPLVPPPRPPLESHV